MTERYELGGDGTGLDSTLESAGARAIAERLWARDASLWKPDPEHRKIIAGALGWLDVIEPMRARAAELTAFAEEVRRRGATSLFLLGMGGSSLAPEVGAATFGPRPGFPALTVLDTTHPDAIAAAEGTADLARTFFLVSSKSGGTLESVSLEKYFFARASALAGASPGRSFAAVTDPGTSLARLGGERGYARVFLNPADIGGRYSALSSFGLVPMALAGADIGALLERAARMAERCGPAVPPRDNPGLALGVLLGTLARAGRDKVTFVLAPEIAGLGAWLEQLLAESTGKEDLGIVPVAGEALGDPGVYASDRVFVAVWLRGSRAPAPAGRLAALRAAGHPVLSWELVDELELGAEFFRWEIATAAAGAILGIDPFDQPNVQESKDATARLIAEYRRTGRLDQPAAFASGPGMRVFGRPELAPGGAAATPAARVAAYLLGARPGDYVALLAYLPRVPQLEARIERLRGAVRDRARVATTVGFGPRYLHSTGQLHKGGPDRGLFLELTAEPAGDLPIPGEPYTFGTLLAAQALGDLESLGAHGRRVLRLDLAGDPAAGLEALIEAVEAAPAR